MIKSLLIAFCICLTCPLESFSSDPYDLRYHSSISFTSNVDEKLKGPVSIVFDKSNEEILVVDTKRSEVLIYNYEGFLVASFDSTKGISYPLDIAVSGTNYLLIESSKKYVSVLSFNGQKKAEIIPPAEFADDFEPKRIVVDEDGFIYITDITTKTCFVFDSTFKFVRKIGKGLRSLTDVAVYGDLVYLLDSIGNYAIHIYSKTGEHQRSFEAQHGRGGTLNIPLSLNLDDNGNLWIVDALAGLIVYDKNLKNIARLAKDPNRGYNYISYPVDIDFGPENSVYIIDRTTKSVKIFK